MAIRNATLVKSTTGALVDTRVPRLIKQKDESYGNEDHMSMIQDYRSKIESKLSNIYNGILKLLDTRLISSAATSDSEVFYLKH
ncbi:14-3-3-like protein [Quercus suber]|uniref:14-3-3-like protein n=1 Tax=Quercus suber TaxID=58331 RepID=A0AAW0KVD1_QUESU